MSVSKVSTNVEEPKVQEPSALAMRVRQGVPAPIMLKLCLDAVQTLDRSDHRLHWSGFDDPSPQMMLTLLSYCYAMGIYASHDIVWAVENDSTVRYICARKRPDWAAIRHFRRHHRDLLCLSLVHVFKQAWALKLDGAEVDFLGYNWFETELSSQIETEVQDRIDLAVIMDSVETD